MDYTSTVPEDGAVYALSKREDYPRAEFVYTPGSDGAERRVAWRVYDRHGRGLLLTQEEVENLAALMSNFEE